MALRSIWNGSITFGLVRIPVKLYAATQDKGFSFNQVHRSDGGRIRYSRVCESCGQQVPYADIVKGYETPSGELVYVTDEDLKSLPLNTTKQVQVVEFVDAAAVDPILFTKSYYLAPDTAGAQPYVLLTRAMEATGKVAVAKVALRGRESLAALRVRDGVLVLEMMLWPDEVRAPEFPFLAEQEKLRPQELAMAGMLVESMAADFDPAQYTDDYRAALQELVDAKVAGRDVAGPQAPEPTAGEDLLETLRASVEAVQGRPRARREAAADAEAPAGQSPGTSAARPPATTTKKAAGKRPARKQTTAKKAAAKRSSAGRRGA